MQNLFEGKNTSHIIQVNKACRSKPTLLNIQQGFKVCFQLIKDGEFDYREGNGPLYPASAQHVCYDN